MAQTVQLKRSAVAGKVPTTSDLALGEIAINTYDGRIFFKKDPGSPSVITVVTTDDTQTLANKTLDSVTLTGTVTADGNVGTAGQVLTSNGSAVYWSTVSGGGGGGATNLSTTTTGNTVTIVSDTGTDAVISGANSTVAGVVTTGDQTFAGNKTFSSTIVGSINGNAGTATALQTPRNINGVTFDGTANITITAATPNNLTIGSGLSGTSFNGSAAVTIAIDSTVATLSGTQTLTNKTVQSRVVTYTSATSITIDGDTTDVAIMNNTETAGTFTINAPTGTPYDGQKILFRLKSTNVQTFSWNSAFVGSTDAALPVASTGSGSIDYMGFVYEAVSAKWQLVAKNFGF